MTALLRRGIGKLRRSAARAFVRRPLHIRTEVPLVSFTFDDAPLSAFKTGAAILEDLGLRGTFYVSLGLAGRQTELGATGSLTDVHDAHRHGHELGCHTHDHLDAWACSAGQYLESVERNRVALAQVLPGVRLRTFAYPKSGAHVAVKAALEQRFEACRGGGQTYNTGVVDRNLLNAVFLDRRAGIDLDAARTLLQRNANERGWLIFAAHEITDAERPFACAPQTLGALARAALDSGAAVLPVGQALDRLDPAALQRG